MSDVDILLAAFLGTPFAQSVTAELGQDVVEAIWLKGFSEAQEIHGRSLDRIGETLNTQPEGAEV